MPTPGPASRAIERASGSAQLHRYVLGLPMGYRTVVGERGVSLSGGQRQRLAIARALMLKPAVMIFDDSTAAIDAGTEQRIRRALRAYSGDRVTIIIAHRLGSLMHADRILFLDDGAWSRAAPTPSSSRSAAATARCTTSSSCPATRKVSA